MILGKNKEFTTQSSNSRLKKLTRPMTAQNIQILPDSQTKNNNHTQISQTNQTKLSGKLKSQQAFTMENQNELVRIKPKNMYYDKEKLYEETIHLKNNLNKILKENNILKVKCLNLTKENEKYEKMVENFQKQKQQLIHQSSMENFQSKSKYNTNCSNIQQNSILYTENSNKDNQIVMSYRKQLKEKINEFTEQKKQLESLKKYSKLTKMQELDSELKEYKEECGRLRKILDQQMILKQKPQKEEDIESLREENIEMAMLVKELQWDMEKDNQKIKELEKHIKQIKHEKKQIARQLEHSEELRQIKFMDKSMAKQQEERKKDKLELENYRQIIGDKDKELLNLKKEMAFRIREFNQIQAQNQEKQLAMAENIQNEQNTYQIISMKYENEKEHNINECNKKQVVLDLIGISEHTMDSLIDNTGLKEIEKQIQLESWLGQDILKKQKSRRNYDKSITKKRMAKVNRYQLETLGRTLQYSLKLSRISYDRIQIVLFSQKLLELKEASITDMINQFQREPFNLRKNEELTLLCRYLVEENNEPFVIVDMDKRQSNDCIRSIFKTLIGHYGLLESEQQLKIYKVLSGILSKYEKGLRDQFKFYIQNRKQNDKQLMDTFIEGYLERTSKPNHSKANEYLAVNRDELNMGLSFIDRELSIQETDYLWLKMFSKSGDCNVVVIDELFTYFNGDNYQEDTSYDPYNNIHRDQQANENQQNQQNAKHSHRDTDQQDKAYYTSDGSSHNSYNSQ